MDQTNRDSHRLNQNPNASSKLRVLVVDDQVTVRTAIVALLNARGYDALSAEDGDGALAILRDQSFDVMLADIRMPGMSGLDLLTEALKIDQNLPVLMLTAVTDVGTAREAIKRGAMDYLSKPIEMDDLDRAVRSAANYHRDKLRRTSGPQPVVNDTKPATEEYLLQGGPLSDGKVRLEERDVFLWVVMQEDGEHVWAAAERPTGLPAGATLIGSYAPDGDTGTMTWTPEAV